MANARSMPAVIPAEVHTEPSTMKMRSSSTFTFGNRACNSRARCQCVVARRPSSRPASASTNAPVHVEAIVGIGSTLFSQFTAGFGGNQPTIDNAMALVLGALSLLGLGIFGSGIANGIVSGGPQLGAGAAVGAGLAAGGVVAAGVAGAGLAAGAGGGGLAGAGRG